MTTTTTDLRTTVAYAIDPLAWCEYGDQRIRAHTLTQADAAIAAATPLIRAAVIEELAERAESQARLITVYHEHEEGDYTTFSPLPDWLRARKEADRE